jgi:hypothetical protein
MPFWTQFWLVVPAIVLLLVATALFLRWPFAPLGDPDRSPPPNARARQDMRPMRYQAGKPDDGDDAA